MQWSDDEAYAARMVNNEVHFYATADFAAGIAHRLRCQGVAALAMAPGSAGDPKFAVFVPEAKGAPGSVRLHSLSQLTAETPQPLARRSFFKCTEVRLTLTLGPAVVVSLCVSRPANTPGSLQGEYRAGGRVHTPSRVCPTRGAPPAAARQLHLLTNANLASTASLSHAAGESVGSVVV